MRRIDFAQSFLISDSHNLITVQPSFRNVLLTLASRSLFLLILFSQYVTFVFGITKSLGLQCQKSESIKTAIFFLRKTISGLHKILLACLAKYILRFFNSLITNNSGVVFFERMFCMFLWRCFGVRLSMIPAILGRNPCNSFRYQFYKKLCWFCHN